ncbi:hypothetical protein OAM00_02945 [Verrucomicrobia bacterium]|nr:hypothetical protein [Verrucomicrobiota bacterium]
MKYKTYSTSPLEDSRRYQGKLSHVIRYSVANRQAIQEADKKLAKTCKQLATFWPPVCSWFARVPGLCIHQPNGLKGHIREGDTSPKGQSRR